MKEEEEFQKGNAKVKTERADLFSIDGVLQDRKMRVENKTGQKVQFQITDRDNNDDKPIE